MAIAEKLDAVTLPDGYSWGAWSGEYRRIERDGRVVCAVGGVTAKVEREMQGAVNYAIAKGEHELARAAA